MLQKKRGEEHLKKKKKGGQHTVLSTRTCGALLIILMSMSYRQRLGKYFILDQFFPATKVSFT